MTAPQSFPTKHLARIVFTTFLLTFIASRFLVVLIMTKKAPDMFLHVGGTHVHHLNYGIFLLSVIGGVLLFLPVGDTERRYLSIAYGFAMALTFDEFGMWVHLGGSYWQQASVDAIIVVLCLFGMIAFAPRLSQMRSHHWATAGVTLVAVVAFYWMLIQSVRVAEKHVGTRLLDIEQAGPQ